MIYMQKKTLIRTGYSLSVFLSVIFFHWWITLFLIVAGVILFPHYYEALVFFFLLNVLHGQTTESSKVAKLTLVSVAVFELIEYLKLQLRVHG
jgi:hypothetical protein